MKCPHCNYEHDDNTGKWNNEKCEYEDAVKGEYDGFYTLPLSLERTNHRYYYGRERQTVELYGCPQCNKTFIG